MTQGIDKHAKLQLYKNKPKSTVFNSRKHSTDTWGLIPEEESITWMVELWKNHNISRRFLEVSYTTFSYSCLSSMKIASWVQIEHRWLEIHAGFASLTPARPEGPNCQNCFEHWSKTIERWQVACQSMATCMTSMTNCGAFRYLLKIAGLPVHRGFSLFPRELFFFKCKSERGAYLQYVRAYVVYSANEALG